MPVRASGGRRILIPSVRTPALRPPRGPVESLSGHTMGTTWRVCVAGGGRLTGLTEAVDALLASLVADLSHWDPGSALSRYNRAPAGAEVALPPALAEVLSTGLAIAAETGGAFDPTLGALVDLWGFGPPGPVAAPPGEAALAEARATVGWHRLRLAGDRAHQPGGLRLDLSGIAKGYAVDCVSALLAVRGWADHLVEIGGELRGSGLKPDGSPWWVALEGGSAPETVVALHGLSVASSGEYRRVFTHGGRRFGHTLDPRYAFPIQGGLRAVSVLHESCMRADAYATALLALGPRRGLAFAARAGLAARFVPEGKGEAEDFSPTMTPMLG